MQPGLLIMFGIWLGVLILLVQTAKSDLCKQTAPEAVGDIWENLKFGLDANLGHYEGGNPVSSRGAAARPGAPVPSWFYSMWPYLLSTIVTIPTIVGLMFLTAYLNPIVQKLFWVTATGQSDLFVGLNNGFATLPGWFIALGACTLISKVSMIPFPALEMYGVFWPKIIMYSAKLPASKQASERKRLLTEAWRRFRPEDVAQSSWLLVVQACIIIWLIAMPIYILLLDDFVRIEPNGVHRNTWLGLFDKVYDFNSIEYARFTGLPGGFVINTKDGTEFNLWEMRGILGPSNETLLAIATKLKSHNVPLVVSPLLIADDYKDFHKTLKELEAKMALSDNLHRVDFRIERVKDKDSLERVAAGLEKSKGVRKVDVSRTKPYWAALIYDSNETNFASITTPFQLDENCRFVLAEEKAVSALPLVIKAGGSENGLPAVAETQSQTPASSSDSSTTAPTTARATTSAVKPSASTSGKQKQAGMTQPSNALATAVQPTPGSSTQKPKLDPLRTRDAVWDKIPKLTHAQLIEKMLKQYPPPKDMVKANADATDLIREYSNRHGPRPVVLVFAPDLAPAFQMKDQIESARAGKWPDKSVGIVVIDVLDRRDETLRKFIDVYFRGKKAPFTVIFNKSGYMVWTQEGKFDPDLMVKEALKLL